MLDVVRDMDGPWCAADTPICEQAVALGTALFYVEEVLSRELRFAARDYRNGDLSEHGLWQVMGSADALLRAVFGVTWKVSDDRTELGIYPV